MKSKNIYYRVYEWLLMAATVVFLLVVYVEIPPPIDLHPIYPDTIIKAVSPLKHFDEDDAMHDYVTF